MENVCGVVLPKIGAEGEAGLLLMAASAKWITGAILSVFFARNVRILSHRDILKKCS